MPGRPSCASRARPGCRLVALLFALSLGSATRQPVWISGGLNVSRPAASCGTCNGCTGGKLFLACESPTASITNLTFAAYGDPSQCPSPRLRSCTAGDSLAVVQRACIGKPNCTVAPADFGDPPSCVDKVADGAVRVLATAVCSEPGARANQLRTEFRLPGQPTAGEVSVSSLGYNTLLCNGQRVAPNLLEPGRSGARRVFFSTFDLLPCLKSGPKVLAAVLGNGWWSASGAQPGATQSAPALWLNATITTPGGQVQVVSDGSWRSSTGRTVYNSVYQGEVQDLRLGLDGWATSGFDASDWLPVLEAPSPGLQLARQTRPPVVAVATHKPIAVNRTANGVLVDFGQNMAGTVKISGSALRAERGAEVVVRHCEGARCSSRAKLCAVLNHPPLSNGPPDECFYGELVNAAATDRYVLSEDPARIADGLLPQFTIHGFRYATITGTGAPNVTMDNVEAIEISADVPQTGVLSFAGAPVLQKVQQATLNSQRSNLQDIPTDCNQRDERLGWMGDAALAVEQAIYNFARSADTYEQWLDMIADEQGEDGSLGDITPFIWQLGTQQPGDPNWGTAYATVANAIWRNTNNTLLVNRHLDNLVAYIGSLERSVQRDGGLSNIRAPLGDWLAPKDAPDSNRHLVSASAFIRDVRAVADMARAVRNSTVAQQMDQLESRLVGEFNQAWQGNGTYASGQQAELALALELDVVPADQVDMIVEALVSDIKAHDWHVTTGIVGTRALFEALAINGRTDVALAAIANPTAPSYGYMVGNKAEPSTTLWENWYADQIPTDQDDASRNHVMFGSVSAFFWKYLAGLTPTAAGWSSLRVAPSFGERCNITTSLVPPQESQLSGLNASLWTAAGTVTVRWRVGAVVELNVTMPEKSQTLEVWIPCVGATEIVQLAGADIWRDGAFVRGGSTCVTHGEKVSSAGAFVQFLVQAKPECATLAFTRH